MATDNDWWSRRLGSQPQQARPPAVYQQPQVPTQRPVHPQSPYAQPQPERHTTIETIYEDAMTWQGGPAMRTETQSCPKCGGSHYFSRTNEIARGPAPAPMCYDCGYNGMFSQGDPAVWQGA